MDVDILIVGAGPAGLAAALTLGRANKRALLCDAGPRRNATATHIHNFVTRDGTPPDAFRLVAREQLAAYPGVVVRDDAVVGIAGERGAFQVALASGEVAGARRVLLCTGMIDELPEIEGYSELWGRSIFQCPYCHGWEVRGSRWGYLASERTAAHLGMFATMLRGWTRDVVVFTGGAVEVADDVRAGLHAAGVRVETAPIERLHAAGDGGGRVRDDGGGRDQRRAHDGDGGRGGAVVEASARGPAPRLAAPGRTDAQLAVVAAKWCSILGRERHRGDAQLDAGRDGSATADDDAGADRRRRCREGAAKVARSIRALDRFEISLIPRDPSAEDRIRVEQRAVVRACGSMERGHAGERAVRRSHVREVGSHLVDFDHGPRRRGPVAPAKMGRERPGEFERHAFGQAEAHVCAEQPSPLEGGDERRSQVNTAFDEAAIES